MSKIKRLKDLALYEYFVKIDNKFVDITKDLIKYNSEKLKEINKLEKENKELKHRIYKYLHCIEIIDSYLYDKESYGLIICYDKLKEMLLGDKENEN